MLRFVLGRLALAIPTLLAISALVFFSAYLAPGDPADAILGEKATPVTKARLRHQLGLDAPPLTRYVSYVGGIVAHGDFGVSYQTREPVKQILARGFPNTALLASLALLTSLLIGIPLGILAAVTVNRLPDRIAMVLALLGVALPSFVLGPALVLLLAVRMGAFPVIGFSVAESGRNTPIFFVLPVVVLAARSTALIARLTRSAMLDVLSQEFVRTARAKGLSTGAVLFKHALKNAFPPILTVAGTTFGYLLSGSFVVETFFTIPGIGNESISSILKRDYPVVQGLSLMMAAGFVGINLIVDILYGVLDPRARVGGGALKRAGA